MRDVQKASRLWLYLPKQRWSTNEAFIFIKLVPFSIQHAYSSEYFIGRYLEKTKMASEEIDLRPHKY